MDNVFDKVSVIVPIYNSELFLQESILSVLNQTYNNIEIIAINDGSTDQSLDILQKYSDKITIISQKNQGLANAVNAGIKKTTGKWIKWFSPDDVLFPEAIKTLVNEAKKLPENTIIYSNWELIDENNKHLRAFSEKNYNHLGNFEFNLRLLDGQLINVNTTLIPSNLFEKGCLIQPLENPVAIDYDFFLRAGILFGTEFHLIPKSLVKYRIHKDQLSHRKVLASLSFLDIVRNQILAKLSNSEKEKYLIALQKYRKKKPLQQKTLDFSLSFLKNILPDKTTDQILVFYLNKIRRTR